MPGLRADIDPEGLQEFSVVFTDRSLNHMSAAFQAVMRDIHEVLVEAYGATRGVLVPGGGTFAMEAVARQFAHDQKVLVVRNGYFSYRWSQIFEAGAIPSEEIVLSARRQGNASTSPFAPAPIAEVVAQIRAEQPSLVFAPHVETASGIILPDDYVRALADAVHEVGGLLVIDAVASGCVWVDMRKLEVDVLVSAPQKSWSAPPSAGIVMLNERALARCRQSTSSSFAADLRRWLEVMDAYLAGGSAYHATMPTDALRSLRDVMFEARDSGLERLAEAQWELGRGARRLLGERGFRSVAAEGFEAPGVVVCYTDDPEIQSGRRFAAAGVQIAAGVPLMVGEGGDYRSFRIGLFGLDKLKDVPATLRRLDAILEKVTSRSK